MCKTKMLGKAKIKIASFIDNEFSPGKHKKINWDITTANKSNYQVGVIQNKHLKLSNFPTEIQ